MVDYGHLQRLRPAAGGEAAGTRRPCAATSRRADSLADLKARYGEQLWTHALDIRNLEEVKAVVDRAFAELGRIDVLVSNAGYGVLGAAEETTNDQLRDIVDTNLLGSIALIREALPHLRAQGGGRVLQVSSEGGQIAYPGFSLYHATKWGIEGFVEAVAKEVAGFGIHFTLVEPGPARTQFANGIVQAEPLAAYAGTPPRQLRDAAFSGAWVIAGDPDRMTDAMIEVADAPEAPLRLVLGAAAYEGVRQALVSRLEALDAQECTAREADFLQGELVQQADMPLNGPGR